MQRFIMQCGGAARPGVLRSGRTGGPSGAQLQVETLVDGALQGTALFLDGGQASFAALRR